MSAIFMPDNPSTCILPYIYSWEADWCPIPFYIGYGRLNDINSPNKINKELSGAEFYRRSLGKTFIARYLGFTVDLQIAQDIAKQLIWRMQVAYGGCHLNTNQTFPPQNLWPIDFNSLYPELDAFQKDELFNATVQEIEKRKEKLQQQAIKNKQRVNKHRNKPSQEIVTSEAELQKLMMQIKHQYTTSTAPISAVINAQTTEAVIERYKAEQEMLGEEEHKQLMNNEPPDLDYEEHRKTAETFYVRSELGIPAHLAEPRQIYITKPN